MSEAGLIRQYAALVALVVSADVSVPLGDWRRIGPRIRCIAALDECLRAPAYPAIGWSGASRRGGRRSRPTDEDCFRYGSVGVIAGPMLVRPGASVELPLSFVSLHYIILYPQSLISCISHMYPHRSRSPPATFMICLRYAPYRSSVTYLTMRVPIRSESFVYTFIFFLRRSLFHSDHAQPCFLHLDLPTHLRFCTGTWTFDLRSPYFVCPFTLAYRGVMRYPTSISISISHIPFAVFVRIFIPAGIPGNHVATIYTPTRNCLK
uniref:Secreted protein n=1 Tax=Mycena chlorophos TaxID=658473 RepID=A0ABQ0L5N8_MYCCL|nr:predicted protein [Mycena chlorophos]